MHDAFRLTRRNPPAWGLRSMALFPILARFLTALVEANQEETPCRFDKKMTKSFDIMAAAVLMQASISVARGEYAVFFRKFVVSPD